MRKKSKRSFLTFRLPSFKMVLVNWLLTVPLILVAGAWHDTGRRIISDDQSLDAKVERVGKRLEMSGNKNMAKDLHGKMNDEINMGNLLGHDWHLVEEQEREGECPGTREKVGNTEFMDMYRKFVRWRNNNIPSGGIIIFQGGDVIIF